MFLVELKNRIRSFSYAWKGVQVMFGQHPNFKIQLFFACLAIILGIVCSISLLQWCIILLCIGLVLALETINSAIEYFVDLVHPEFHPLAGRVKDLAAAAVLIFSIISVIVGLLIFIPALSQIRFY
ncbi:MAG: diacylglycerol kinase family protein [Bacteroidia bacterium]